MRVTPRTRSPLRCAYCHGELAGRTEPCGGCGTRVHAECGDGRRCPTLGCRRVAARAARPAAPRPTRSELRVVLAVWAPPLVCLLLYGGVQHVKRAASEHEARRITGNVHDPLLLEQLSEPTDDDVLAASRALLDVPFNHGRTLARDEVPAAIRARSPRFVQVYPRAVVIGLEPGEGLVATREGCALERDLLGDAGDSLTTEAVVPGLWRYARW